MSEALPSCRPHVAWARGRPGPCGWRAQRGPSGPASLPVARATGPRGPRVYTPRKAEPSARSVSVTLVRPAGTEAVSELSRTERRFPTKVTPAIRSRSLSRSLESRSRLPPHFLLHMRKPLIRSVPATSSPSSPQIRRLAGPACPGQLKDPVVQAWVQRLARRSRKRRAGHPTAWPFRAVTTRT